MKILFVFTGGTIGCTVSGGIADTDISVSGSITSLCGAEEGDIFEYASPYNILSENLNCETLSELCTFMLSVDYEKYDGVIVTHGSDTLAYSAALLGHALSWVKIPVVITAANYVIDDPRSNARDNLSASYRLISDFSERKNKLRGVFAVWKNPGAPTAIYPAIHLLEADPFDRFGSWGNISFGKADDIHHDDSLSFLRSRIITLKNNVLLLHSCPGMDYGNINIKGKEAVLLKLYHSGTTCMAGERTSFNYLADMCKKSNVDLYITPTKRGSYHYRSEEGFKGTGAIPISGISEIAAYTGLLLAYSLENNERKIILKKITAAKI